MLTPLVYKLKIIDYTFTIQFKKKIKRYNKEEIHSVLRRITLFFINMASSVEPFVGLQCVIVAFTSHTHLLFVFARVNFSIIVDIDCLIIF